jgi:flavin-dependent dehydrogenase
VSTYDVAILGGGLAGLSLSIQLKRARPSLTIVVIEKKPHPVVEAAFKVGESTVEIGAHYFAEVIGMKEHLDTAQLEKLGLRFFLPADGNKNIANRVEFGPQGFPDTVRDKQYQLDRGRFENALASRVVELGMTFHDDSSVTEIELGGGGHRVSVQGPDGPLRLQARWVVDTSGRGQLLKRKLGLQRKVGHAANAAWFRVAHEIDIQQWSDDQEWRDRVPRGDRRLSTNHLMGEGYWVWLIPLASGSTSVGVVADPQFHPFESINRFDRVLEWLYQHEPQCAEAVAACRDTLQDFRVLKHFAHSATQVFSEERWCTSGEAGVFLDPLYSPGSDFIAISNSLVTSLILEDLAGKPIHGLIEAYQEIYLKLFEQAMTFYENQYQTMGNSQVMHVKVVWDACMVGQVRMWLYLMGKLTDQPFIESIRPELNRFSELNRAMQNLFREWTALDNRNRRGNFCAIRDIGFMVMVAEAFKRDGTEGDDVLKERFAGSLTLAERLAVEIFHRAAGLVTGFQPRPVNPYAISLSPDRWEADGLFDAARCVDTGDGLPGVDRLWLQVAPDDEYAS